MTATKKWQSQQKQLRKNYDNNTKLRNNDVDFELMINH